MFALALSRLERMSFGEIITIVSNNDLFMTMLVHLKRREKVLKTRRGQSEGDVKQIEILWFVKYKIQNYKSTKIQKYKR